VSPCTARASLMGSRRLGPPLSVCLCLLLAAWGPAAHAGEGKQASPMVAPEDVAQRLGATFHVDPATIAVGGKPTTDVRLEVLEVSLPKHDPPLWVRVEASTGQIVRVLYGWPGAEVLGRVKLPKSAPRAPVVDEAAAQDLAVAAIGSCLGALPKSYELVEARFNDDGLSLYYMFRWEEVVQGVRLPHRIIVYVDAYKGRVASLSRHLWPITVSLEPRITADQAIRTALERSRPRLQTGEALATPKAILQAEFVATLEAPYPNDRQFLMWSIIVYTAGATPRPVLWVKVDALTGEVIEELIPSGAGKAWAASMAGAPMNSAVRRQTPERSDPRVWSGGLAVVLVLGAALLLLARRRARARALQCAGGTQGPPCP
jgi:hypothetical protein